MFYDNFVNLCAGKGKSPSAVAVELGITKSNVTYWKKGRNNPSDVTLAKIAEYFGVSLDELKGEEATEKPSAVNGEELSPELIKLYLSKMSTTDLASIMADCAEEMRKRSNQ